MQHPKPKFKIGDRVVDEDGVRRGRVEHVGEYDAYLGGYRYKVQEDGGPRHFWNETSMARMRVHHSNQTRVRGPEDATSFLKATRDIIDLDGHDDYETEQLHPGAVLVAFNRGSRVVAVINPDYEGDAGDAVDEDDAVAAASKYAIRRDLVRAGADPDYYLVLTSDDVDDPGMREKLKEEVKDVVTSTAEEEAAREEATSRSTYYEELPSHVFDKKDVKRYDVEDRYVIARCGGALAVEGEYIISPHWARELGLGSGQKAELWSEVRLSYNKLRSWLKENGYDLVGIEEQRGSESNQELPIEPLLDRIVERVKDATESKAEQELIEELAREVLEEEYHVSGSEVRVGAPDCHTEFWVKRLHAHHHTANQQSTTVLAFQYTVTDSDDYGHQHWAVVSGVDREEALEQFTSAVEDGDAEIWSAEAIEKGDTVEHAEAYNTAPEHQLWYLSWTDYEAALSAEELAEAKATDEWPDVDSSTEAVQISSDLTEFGSVADAVAMVEKKSHRPPTFLREAEE